MELKVLKNDNFPKDVELSYATNGSAGFDLVAAEDITIEPHTVAKVDTGIKVEIPAKHEMQIRPRSGLALKNYISVINSPGTIDADYRDTVCVLLINHGNLPFNVTKGMRIAQAVIAPYVKVEINMVEKLSKSKRKGGFGSTGV